MLLLWTDELDRIGWRQLQHSLNGTRAGRALGRVVGSPPAPDVDAVGHVLAAGKPPERKNAAHKDHHREYEPSALERREACRLHAFDCQLFRQLRNRSCACAEEGERRVTRAKGAQHT